jgi:hypothetical protein
MEGRRLLRECSAGEHRDSEQFSREAPSARERPRVYSQRAPGSAGTLVMPRGTPGVKRRSGFYVDAIFIDTPLGTIVYDGNTLPSRFKAERDIVDASVFAPSTVPSGEEFLVQVFLHKLKDKGTAGKFAREHDQDATRHGIVLLQQKLLTIGGSISSLKRTTS